MHSPEVQEYLEDIDDHINNHVTYRDPSFSFGAILYGLIAIGIVLIGMYYFLVGVIYAEDLKDVTDCNSIFVLNQLYCWGFMARYAINYIFSSVYLTILAVIVVIGFIKIITA